MFRYLLLALCTLVLIGCEQKTEKPVESAKPPAVQLQALPEVTQEPLTLLKDPIEAVLVETAAEAIPVWRKYAKAKPTLVLLAKNPLLQQLPASEKSTIRQLVMRGATSDFAQLASTTYSAATMFPNMSLSAALEQGFFNKVIWGLPMPPGGEISLADFLQKLLVLGDISQAEADSFSTSENGFSGKIRGIPFLVTNQEKLPPVNEPAVVHLDLSYLAATYQNEIRTPLYKHTHEALRKLQTLGFQIFGTTICRSNLTGEIALRTRFLGKYIREIIQTPERLETKLNKVNNLRNQALYLENFFKKDEILSINQELVATTPEDPAAHYDLYQTLRQHQQTDQALMHLKRAADLDVIYAMEYLTLANLGVDKHLAGGTIDMLELAESYFPDNFFIKLNLVQIYSEIGLNKEMREKLSLLQKLKWSNSFHQNAQQQIKEFATGPASNTAQSTEPHKETE